jgi:hypothetical protein
VKFTPSSFLLKAFVSSIFVWSSTLEAQVPSGSADLRSPTSVLINGNSGKSFAARQSKGRFDEVAIVPRQTVSITLSYSPTLAGQIMFAEPLDGGKIILVGRSLTIGADGTLSFNFQAGDIPGVYRVWVHQNDRGAQLYFWVRDTANPANNPEGVPSL